MTNGGGLHHADGVKKPQPVKKALSTVKKAKPQAKASVRKPS